MKLEDMCSWTGLIKGFVSSDRATNQKNRELIVSLQNCLLLKVSTGRMKVL